MKNLIVLSLILTISACVPAWKPLCRHDAIYTGIVAGGDEVICGWYDNGRRNEYHIVTRKLIGGVQYYLVPFNGYIWAKKRIKGFEPIEETVIPFKEYYNTYLTSEVQGSEVQGLMMNPQR